MAAGFKDYYEILKVPRSATTDDIRKSYRKLAREHHPDLHPEKEKDLHTKRMQEINEAYTVLSSPDNRAKYDALGESWDQPQAPPPPRRSPAHEQQGPSADYSGFSDFFRRMFEQEAPGQGHVNTPGELDIEAVLELTLEEAVRGVEKTFSLVTTGLCPTCHGTGRAKNGTCPMCGGLGEIRQPRQMTTKIPRGLTDGARIRLKGQGNQSGATRGDLYLDITLRPDPRFRVDGKNLETEITIPPWQAALGAEARVPTVDGPVTIRIPKQTHAGARLRVAGKGLGKPSERGDLLVRVTIDLPATLSTKAEALYRELEKEHG
jgi:DnaJ-class molecular chaperone